MEFQKIAEHIQTWLIDYLDRSGCGGFVVGVSGGIDSAVVSYLCAKTGRKTLLVALPIGDLSSGHNRASQHINQLCSQFKNVSQYTIDLTEPFRVFSLSMPFSTANNELIMANIQSRMRMIALYAVAQKNACLVVGTGNKIEDFAIGFFTKYGDGGVDISPIADLLKSEVYALASYLKIAPEIINAPPTDGLFGDLRTDQQQIGASYPELEWAMSFSGDPVTLSERQKEVQHIYQLRKQQNAHKMNPIPVCIIPTEYKQ